MEEAAAENYCISSQNSGYNVLTDYEWKLTDSLTVNEEATDDWTLNWCLSEFILFLIWQRYSSIYLVALHQYRDYISVCTASEPPMPCQTYWHQQEAGEYCTTIHGIPHITFSQKSYSAWGLCLVPISCVYVRKPCICLVFFSGIEDSLSPGTKI